MASEKTIVRKAKQEIKGMTDCIQCGECCRNIRVTGHEFAMLKNYLTVNNLWDELTMNMETQMMVAETYDVKPMYCYLLRSLEGWKTECMAYHVRTIICRLQGIKKELPCKNTDNPQVKIGKWTEKYYKIIRDNGFSLNSALEKTLKERR